MMETPDSTVTPTSGADQLRRKSDQLRRKSDEMCGTDDSCQTQNQVNSVVLYGVAIVSLAMDGHDRLCLAQISNTLLKGFSYNEIHNRRVALGITCIQCTPVQLEILRRAGAMPVSSRRCGMITKREAERLCKSFLGDNSPPKLPDNFTFDVLHLCAWGCRGEFYPGRYNSSRAKCIKCSLCGSFYSPNKFIFHSHHTADASYVQPDAANFNSWRRHIRLHGSPSEQVVHAWEDVKAMFNGGTRKRSAAPSATQPQAAKQARQEGQGAHADLATSYPDLVRPTPSLVTPAAACFPRLPAFGAYKRLSGLEASSFADYLWPATKWAELSPLAPAHLWPKRPTFGFPLAAPTVLGGLLDYSMYGLPPPLPPQPPPPQLHSPHKEQKTCLPPASSAFHPLRQPWLPDSVVRSPLAAGIMERNMLETEVRNQAIIGAEVRASSILEATMERQTAKPVDERCANSASTDEDDKPRSIYLVDVPQREKDAELTPR